MGPIPIGDGEGRVFWLVRLDGSKMKKVSYRELLRGDIFVFEDSVLPGCATFEQGEILLVESLRKGYIRVKRYLE